MLADQHMVVNAIIPHLDKLFEMIMKNIFRPLPVLKKQNQLPEAGVEEEDIIIDPSWPHLQPIYELFYQLILNDACDVKSLKGFVTHGFIQEVGDY